jgi:hypothetical protein
LQAVSNWLIREKLQTKTVWSFCKAIESGVRRVVEQIMPRLGFFRDFGQGVGETI